MKKGFKFYAIAWAILLAAFVAIALIVPHEATGAYWAGFAFIVAAFIGQLVCAAFAFKAKDLTQLFYNMPLLRVSWTGLILTIIFGSAAMAIPGCPAWAGAVACIIVLCLTAIAVIKASAAAEVVEKVDDKIKTQTFFIKNFTVDAESLMRRAKSEAVRAECKKVYEAARYSDPMSREELKPIEGEIRERFSSLESAVRDDDAGKSAELAEELTALIAERNSKCKLMK